ncbi:hypothetical protein B0T20DRAFT_356544 [Sordaria brevicollis]|uniref:Heterokaryon incompatibility domain-containing protein n=1 Tax=Sordaria brevicollis TaxID=83679 RepID=A0AAE0PBA7_SORBR|nr:hypothetical protein B0T20DRAFT_356544 [Sordaria brevicollis]
MNSTEDELAKAARKLGGMGVEESYHDPASRSRPRSASRSKSPSRPRPRSYSASQSPALNQGRFRLPVAPPRTASPDSPDSPATTEDDDQQQQPQQVCPSCLDLSYPLFRAFDSHPPILNSYSHTQCSTSPSQPHTSDHGSQSEPPSGSPTTLPPRYLLIEYHDLLQTSSFSEEGSGPKCLYCPLLHKAITLFWDDDPSSYYISKAPVADARSFRRILCLVQQPAASHPGGVHNVPATGTGTGTGTAGPKGGTLSLFKALLYDDYPDATFPHALTVRDSTSRIEFYCDEWDLVDLQRSAEGRKGVKEQGLDEDNQQLKGGDNPGLVFEDGSKDTATDMVDDGWTAEECGDAEELNASSKEDGDGSRKVEDMSEGNKDGQAAKGKETPTPTSQPPHPAIAFASHVPYAITLDRVVKLTTRWLSVCDSSHPKCAPEPHQLPRRLLDLHSGVKLIDTTTNPTINTSPLPPYITLSHCWGIPTPSSPPLLTTTVSTLSAHLSQIPWSSLPLLFRDVIQLVRSLGARYLWIDSLCILQDSEEDWLTESTNMSSIYAHAMLNVAATAQRDASTLFGEVEYFRTPKEPILSRAWVFQERLLSRRTLHFGSSEVLWECRSGCFCECGGIERGHVLSVRNLNNNAAARYRAPGSSKKEDVLESSGLLSPPLPLSRSSTFENGSSLTCGTIPKKVLFANLTSASPETTGSRLLHDFFLRCVEEYSFLSLTKELDRSFALAGIAKQIRSLLSPDDRYLAGLWLHDLPRALLWQPYRHKKVLRAGDNIPTWSWMSRSCYPVENISGYGRGRGAPTASKCSARYEHITRSGYEFELDDRLEVDIDPEKTWCEYEGGNEFGKPKGGQVTLTAACRWGVVWTTGTTRRSNEWTGRNSLVVAVQYDNGNGGEDSGDGGEGVLIPMAPDCPRQEDPKSVALLEKVLVVLFGGRKVDKEMGGSDADGPQFFLALREVEGREGVFQRIGFLESEWRVDLFDNAGFISSSNPVSTPTLNMGGDNTQPNQLVWLITGCSSGFGAEFVRQLLSSGDLVIATARNTAKLSHLQEIPHSENQLSLFQLDVTHSQESLNATVAEAIKVHGRIDVLINNAGYVAFGGWEDLGYKGFVKQFETNVFGVLKVTNAVLPHMRKRKSGSLVFISSSAGWKGMHFAGGYVGSKFALEGMVECLAQEVAPLDIRTLIVEPGEFRTPVLSEGKMLGKVSGIEDYKEASDDMKRYAGSHDSQQRGDPVKAVKITLDVVRKSLVADADWEKVLRLPLGPDCYEMIKQKCEDTLKMLGEWEGVTKSTDLDA